jgi:hypothetical protein
MWPGVFDSKWEHIHLQVSVTSSAVYAGDAEIITDINVFNTIEESGHTNRPKQTDKLRPWKKHCNFYLTPGAVKYVKRRSNKLVRKTVKELLKKEKFEMVGPVAVSKVSC